MYSRSVACVWLWSVLCGLFCIVGNAAAVAPAAPTAMRATAIAYDSIVLSWLDNATDETGLELEYKDGNGSFTAYSTTLPANSVNFFAGFGGSTAGKTFTMRVRAYNLTGPSNTKAYSAYSTAAPVVMPAATVTFLAPSNPAATSTPVSFTPSWTNNATNKSGFAVYGKRSTDANYEIWANVPNSPTTITEFYSSAINDYVAIAPGTTYNFAVRAYINVTNAAGGTDSWLSGASAIATIATKDAITSKTGTSGIPGAAFSHTFNNSAGAAVTSRTLTPLPSTLTFNSSTGALTGTYPPVGVYPLTYTVNFANTWSQTQTFYIRVRPAAGAPVVATTIPAWTTAAGATRDTNLAGIFTDVEAESAVRVSTTMGNMDFILFDTATPATVTNFKNYLARYTDVVFHRSIAGFVIQGGGFRATGTGSNFNVVVKDPTVVNEPGVANVRGTISMAKLGGNPNSATDEFFVSLGDNRSNLDFQNGGFTVFGRVAGNGMTVADSISLLPTRTYGLNLDGASTGTSFSDFPMNAASAPTVMDQSLVVKMNSVTPIPTMTYAISNNSNPAAVSATIVSGQVHLVALAGGTSTVAVTATDLDNLSTSQNVTVTVTDSYTTWAARQSFAGGQNAEGLDPDGDALSNLLEYAFLGDPNVNRTADGPVHGLLDTAPSPQTMTVTFPLRKFTAGLTYEVQVSSVLDSGWTTIWSSTDGFAHPRVESAVDATDRTVVTIKDFTPIVPGSKRFLRTKVTQN